MHGSFSWEKEFHERKNDKKAAKKSLSLEEN
jgi:hypothetical protein